MKSDIIFVWRRVCEGDGYVTFALEPTVIRYKKIKEMRNG